MDIKYCLPIIKTTKEEVIKTIDNAVNEYAYFEVWLDYIENLDDLFVEQLKNQLGARVIIVFRKKNLEPSRLPLEKRIQIVSQLTGSEALVDLDIMTQTQELEHLKTNPFNVKKIVSYHNYHETPDEAKLKKIIDTMQEHNPVILKISTVCNDEKDALRLLAVLLELKSKNINSIVLGMGKFGGITRIFGTLWGNEMIFAPITKDDESAPGQLTKSQLEVIFKELQR